ncbi:DedA family protein [Faunimonas sp. B44]|uniref:DedA family protein n=1 Tax=Faunimonas sp. B44 TaxID=3461493 RepID=UPI00404467F9
MASWIESVVESTGVLGIAFLMLLENVFPPIPSELIMPLAGYAAASGDANIVLVILAGSIGSLAGATFWFVVGRKIGEDGLKRFAARHGRWLTLTPKDVGDVDDWFDRHGHKAVLIGRLVPTVRTLISVPAGISEMSWTRFLVYSGIGTLLWTSALALLGYALGDRYETVETWINPVSNVIFAGIALWYLWRVATFGRRLEREDSGSRGR